MKRNRKDKYNGKHTDVYILCVPVDKTYNNEHRHEKAGYYGFNIYVQNIERQNIEEAVEKFNNWIARRDLLAAAMALSSQHEPAENRYQVDRSDLGTAGHAVGSLLLVLLAPAEAEHRLARWEPEDYNIQEAAYADPEEENNDVKHDLEWQLGKFIVEHIFKSEHVFTLLHY